MLYEMLFLLFLLTPIVLRLTRQASQRKTLRTRIALHFNLGMSTYRVSVCFICYMHSIHIRQQHLSYYIFRFGTFDSFLNGLVRNTDVPKQPKTSLNQFSKTEKLRAY